MPAATRLVGIGGGSCCGKTTLIQGLKAELGPTVTVVSFDDYFVGMERLQGVTVDDWESPTLYRSDDYLRDLALLKAGQSIELECHSRESKALGISNQTVVPTELVIVEGFLIFHWPEARDLFDVRIFVDLPEQQMVERRIARIQGNEGWDHPSYIQSKLIPGHRQYVLPQKACADLILDGREPTERLIHQTVGFLRSAASH